MSTRLLMVVNVDWFFLSHRLPIAIAAQKAGLEVHIATTVQGSIQDIEQHGLRCHPIAIDRKSTRLFHALHVCFEFYRLMISIKPSVVHLVTIKPVLFGSLAARVAGVPHVVAALSGLGFIFMDHGIRATFRRKIVAGFLRLGLRRHSVKIIVQNPDDQRQVQALTGLSENQFVCIPGSGVDLDVYQPLPPAKGRPIVLMASRLLRDKGVIEFLQAARLLKPRLEARFVLVGDVDPGNPTSLVQADLHNWVKEGIVEWWGFRSDMAKVLGSACMVVLPSYREGMPKILLEAAAAGRAVVTTDVPGCRDAITPGVTGLLVPVKDVEALASAIAFLIASPAQCQAYGLAGRLLAEQRFDVGRVVAMHLEAYRSW